MRRLAWFVLASPVLFASGCLVPYWVSPSISFIPATPVSAPADTVYAFRVDTRQSTVCFPGPLRATHQLTPITINPDGDLPAQLRVSCTRGFLAMCVALNYCTWHQDSIAVRLYRPGYDTIELPSWALGMEVSWRKATTHAAQSKAVDDLVAGDFEPGSIAVEHRRALLFAAAEYERLVSSIADSHPAAGQQRLELLGKAEHFRQRATTKEGRGWAERLID
jgi:hypothetical protein